MPPRPARRRLAVAVRGILNRIAAESDLSMTQLRLLGVLRDREPGMMQLAELLGLDKSSVTGLIARGADQVELELTRLLAPLSAAERRSLAATASKLLA
jgi:hypothetical protein